MRGLSQMALAFVTAGLLVSVAAAQTPKVDPEQVREINKAEELLKSKNIDTDGASLLKYFRERTFPEADPKMLAKYIGQLGSANFVLRERAFRKIQQFGTGALFRLKEAQTHDNVETRTRVIQLLTRIEEDADPRVQKAVARLIAHKKPAGAGKVLLGYLPFTDEAVLEQMRLTLTTLAAEDTETAAALAGELTSKIATVRQVVGEALVLANAKTHFAAARKLLKDPEAKVRLPIALALAERKDVTALPVLIDLMKDLEPMELVSAHALLMQLAGKETPQVSLGTNRDDRLKAWKAWQGWWTNQNVKDMEKRLADANLGERYRGFTQILYYSSLPVGPLRRSGRKIMELGVRKQFNDPRWSFVLETSNPVDAQVVGRNRLLVTENTARRITLRDFDGRILKEKYFTTNPNSAEKLRNGNILVVTPYQLYEYDKDWKQVWTYRNGRTIYRANKLSDGTLVLIDSSSRLNFVDSKNNRVLKTVYVGSVYNYYGGIEVLPNDHVLIPEYGNNRVAEYDKNGKQYKVVNTRWPTTAVRLPNGDTLVGSQNSRQLVLINRNNQQIWTQTVPGQLYRIRVR